MNKPKLLTADDYMKNKGAFVVSDADHAASNAAGERAMHEILAKMPKQNVLPKITGQATEKEIGQEHKMGFVEKATKEVLGEFGDDPLIERLIKGFPHMLNVRKALKQRTGAKDGDPMLDNLLSDSTAVQMGYSLIELNESVKMLRDQNELIIELLTNIKDNQAQKRLL